MPLGGLSLWEASLELRFPILAPLGGATFCDASDVSPDPSTSPRYPHLSCGVGLRYDTPIGPVRLDVGYGSPARRSRTGTDRAPTASPAPFYGLPVAFAFGIGEAF